MASIFTYDPDPPRVSSPWTEHDAGRRSGEGGNAADGSVPKRATLNHYSAQHQTATITSEANVTRLSAEPEFGPTEYKLHLLLRPRRSFVTTSTGAHIAGSQHSRSTSEGFPTPKGSPVTAPPALSQSSASRQHRLEQLTTQLLWRLQQSSPIHASAPGNLILPTLPEATAELRPPQVPAKLLAGLEESKGALYEIGVSDDGTFVGLVLDEMNESLNNLTAMAASLGCSVEVLRMIAVGKGEWLEDDPSPKLKQPISRSGQLYVAEAYIKPMLRQSPSLGKNGSHGPVQSTGGAENQEGFPREEDVPIFSHITEEQIRVTLTGATMCGKSSLLGTLSTSTLDNGRGKSRLSLLKHRHEIASGMTSSVAQELIGYSAVNKDNEGPDEDVTVINYATDNISSWNDIHGASQVGRLALLSDSAGHPRYRRTTVRGLVGWAPHWTMLCIAASESKEQSNLSLSEDDDSEPFAGASAHLSMAHLDLCIRLQLPLVVVITKLDAASKSTFRQMLGTLLSTLKSAGRKPLMVASDGDSPEDIDLQRVSRRDRIEISRIVNTMGGDAYCHVPIVFTSAVKGTGIGKIHALLRCLPTMSRRRLQEGDGHNFEHLHLSTLFHIDDVFDLNAARAPHHGGNSQEITQGVVLSGHVSRGRLSVGDEIVLGPFPSEEIAADVPTSAGLPADSSDELFLTPRSFTDALAKAVAPSHMRHASDDREWRRVRVVSIRNLRLPVHSLELDRIGTIGVVFLKAEANDPRPLVRRGMILADHAVKTAHTVTVSFDIKDASSMVVGSRVVIYCTSIRSSAKIVAVALDNDHADMSKSVAEEDGFAFSMESELDEAQAEQTSQLILVTLQLDTYREYLETGAQVLLMPGGGPGLHSGERGIRGLAGLEGFVGNVVETFV